MIDDNDWLEHVPETSGIIMRFFDPVDVIFCHAISKVFMKEFTSRANSSTTFAPLPVPHSSKVQLHLPLKPKQFSHQSCTLTKLFSSYTRLILISLTKAMSEFKAKDTLVSFSVVYHCQLSPRSKPGRGSTLSW